MADTPDITFQIDDAHIRFRNFSGNKTQFNPAGNRNFCVDIPENLVEVLEQDGWNVKFLDPREEGDPAQPYIQVKVKFDFKPPRVVLVKSNGQVNLTEDMVSILDFTEIKKVDLIVRAFQYDVQGKTGLSAYLKTMYVTIEEDELERRYGNEQAQ
jgi:hypothetical protein